MGLSSIGMINPHAYRRMRRLSSGFCFFRHAAECQGDLQFWLAIGQLGGRL
jgi:hypothetical protein